MAILPIDSGRYGSKEIKKIFEEDERLRYILTFEAAVSKAQAKLRIIPAEAADEIYSLCKSNKVQLERVKELESITDHDMGAIVEALGEQCSSKSKPWIHFGLTSNDLIDTTTSMQLRDSFGIIESKILNLALMLSDTAIKYKLCPAVGRTHGQHASILPFGLKFAVWASEMTKHYERIIEARKRFLVCKTLGVVGTGSLMGSNALKVQKIVSKSINLFPVEAATQLVPRERYAEVQFIIALVGSTLDKIAVEIRNLQRTELGELAEPFKEGQMGSSAVPVKRNPIKSERVSSLSKILKSLVNISMDNISLWHERDLSNSANERFTIPMGIILLDEMLNTMIKIIPKLNIFVDKIRSNIEVTKGQIYAEFVLESLISKGVPRMTAYRNIQRLAFSAFEKNQQFIDAIKTDDLLGKHFTKKELKDLFTPENHFASSLQIIENVHRNILNINNSQKH